jgi:hypothetical protein
MDIDNVVKPFMFDNEVMIYGVSADKKLILPEYAADYSDAYAGSPIKLFNNSGHHVTIEGESANIELHSPSGNYVIAPYGDVNIHNCAYENRWSISGDLVATAP